MSTSETSVFTSIGGMGGISKEHLQAASNFKDEILDLIAGVANVAQFVSFAPNGSQRFSRIVGRQPNAKFRDPSAAIEKLLSKSRDGSVNIRSYKPNNLMNNTFVPMLKSVPEVVGHVGQLGATGYYTIVNENIDINDGGFSGVALNGMVEFAPGDTPRCVERAEVAIMSTVAVVHMVRRVYGFVPELPMRQDLRVEFSIHPFPCGFRKGNTIIWEVQQNRAKLSAPTTWPNAFSRWIGDKVFGLLMADMAGFSVPETLVIARRLPPFQFGAPTGSGMKWVRTAPALKTPGKFSTIRGWSDPFRIMATEDPDIEHPMISSVLVQDEVAARFSGAMITQAHGGPHIEGRVGRGDELMVGREAPTKLPASVLEAVTAEHVKLTEKFGSIRAEWVVSEARAPRVWIVQLQQEANITEGDIIVPGDPGPGKWWFFDVGRGLEALREIIPMAKEQRNGIVLVGKIGLTSHLADILREAGVAARRERRGVRQLPLFSPEQ